jgi:hypothetical protein
MLSPRGKVGVRESMLGALSARDNWSLGKPDALVSMRLQA